jgi:hypothetical protein
MPRDFTFRVFRQLLSALKEQRYTFQTFAEFLKNPAERVVILRHDVDARKLNSLYAAELEAEMGIRGTYNFRMVPQSYDEGVIQRISALGHEIGYHYEDLAMAHGDMKKAITLFEQHLSTLRRLVKVETICMHGSPLSRHDNRNMWKEHDYRKYGIIGEPYLDLDFSSILYLTDTGRMWDGDKVSIRDRVKGKQKFQFHSTFDIIQGIKKEALPDQLMINVHPQRWEDRFLSWFSEKALQSIKNVIKRAIGKNYLKLN